MAFLTNEAASSSSSSLPLSSTDQNHYTYEVFLSFRGEDTRFNFIDHLHSALCQKGIETFRDNKLGRGEDISQELLKAIEESRISIIVFSQNYAASRWCLDELVKILECKKSKRQVVRVVFYKMDPSDVRHQRGAFGDAFATLNQWKDSMGKWRKALKEAADLSGWPFKDGEYEAEFIKKIVGELSARVVNPSCELHVTEHPIGLESYRQDINKLLHSEENIVRMVGIWGPGGIGKTTIVKDVFNSIRHKFEGSCFLADVRSKGLTQLQETLLFDILSDSTLKVHNVDKGVGLIKTRMQNKKVLLILDNVSHFSQLQNLVPSPHCFGLSSRILITTRDKRCLTTHEVDEVYEVKMLDYNRALELFSFNAFKRNRPPGDYLELAQRAVRYAQGLPLALIVLGSHLFRRNREEWEAIIDSCKGGPQTEIQDVLRLSYDALGADLKGLFLDIACFFKGEQVDHVKPILEACYDLKSVSGIAQLQEKALIRIEKDAWKGCRIWMHDLIEEMGKDIVYQESLNEPGERSRVWSDEDVNHVLTKKTGTIKVIGIQVPWRSSPVSLNAKSFSEMKNLKFISMREYNKYECDSGDIDFVSNQLRWLDWPNSPLQYFPSDFHANKLVKLNIPDSRGITQLWEGCKNFSRLTYMNLSRCTSLKELPDFSGIPNLKELNLNGCSSLVEVPDSVGFLHNLVTLNVRSCSNLIMFPRKINLKSVETISISYCKLEEFSEVGEDMGSLRSLDLSGTCIKELHPSITKLIGLEELRVVKCQNLTTLPHNIYEFRNLKSLNARYCPKLATFPKIPIKMSSLRGLELRGSDIRELDESIGNLIGLEVLDLGNCKNLTTLPCSIYGLQNLETLYLGWCSKLVTFPTNTKILNVGGCSPSLPKLEWLDVGGSSFSDYDFLMTLDCWETLDTLDLSYNNFVSLPACITKFVNLRTLFLYDCRRLRGIPKLPPKVKLVIEGKSLERFSKLTNPGAVMEPAPPSVEDDCELLDIEAALPPSVEEECELLDIEAASLSIEDDDQEEPTPSSRLSLSSEPPKRHHTPEEPSTVIPPKHHRWMAFWRKYLTTPQRAAGQASVIPDLHSSHHSTTPQLQHHEEPTKPGGAFRQIPTGDQDQWLSLSVRPTLPSTSEFRQ
ncbi:disease resistance protein RPV1-like [Rosa sericea]